MKRLEGRVALVFGAGSVGPGWGNGKASAVAYARAGARVACVDWNSAAATETAGIIRQEGGIAEAFACDVTQSDQVAEAVARTAERLGPIELSEAEWRRQLDLNVTGVCLPVDGGLSARCV